MCTRHTTEYFSDLTGLISEAPACDLDSFLADLLSHAACVPPPFFTSALEAPTPAERLPAPIAA